MLHIISLYSTPVIYTKYVWLPIVKIYQSVNNVKLNQFEGQQGIITRKEGQRHLQKKKCNTVLKNQSQSWTPDSNETDDTHMQPCIF